MKKAEILYGSNLKNKDDIIFNEIKKIIDGGGKVLYIVPEQYAFSADKTVLFRLGEKYSHLTETINFKRMAITVNEKLNPSKKNFITEEIKNLILYKIYCDNVSQLKTLSRRGRSPDSVLIFKDILTELKTNLITGEELDNVISALPEDTYLRGKLCDLKLISEEYEKYISENYKDFEDSFSALAVNISKHELYKDYHVFIDNFIHFSKSEYLVVNALMKNAASIHAVLLGDSFQSCSEGDLFYLTAHTAEVICKTAEDNGYEVSYTLCDGEDGRHLKEIFSSEITVGNSERIVMTEAHTQTDEVRDVVLKIKKLLFSGASYSDIAVFSGDMSVYEDIISSEFRAADIPYFDDKKTPMSENPVCRLLMSAFEFYMSGYAASEMMNYLKNLVFLFGSFDKICLFEKTVSNFRIERDTVKNPEKWEKALDTALLGNKYLTFRKKDISFVYEKFIVPVVKAFSGLKKQNTADDYKECFSQFIRATNIEKMLRLYADKTDDTEFAGGLVNSYNIFIGAIKNISLVNGDTEFSAEDYFALLKQSADVYKTGALPNCIDCVTVSDLERGRSESKKYVFILGLNDGISPKTNENTGFLSDNDRKLIESITGTELPTALWKNNSSLLSFYRACNLSEEIIYLSKSNYSDVGGELTESFMWSFFAANAGETNEADNSYVNLREAVQRAVSESDKESEFFGFVQDRKKELFSDIDKMHEEGYFSLDKKVSKKILNSKFNKKLNISVSRLETYRKCGYSYFLRYLLHVSEPENANYDFAKTGTLVHDIVDSFSKRMAEDNKSWEDVTEDYIDEIVKKAVYYEINEKFPKLNMFNPRTKYLITKLSRTVRTAILYIREHFIRGEFVPLGYEIPIGSDGKKPMSIALSDGSVIEIYGRVDRADGYFDKESNTLHIRIIDYKSSAKNIDFSLVKEGIQLQLLTYLKALIKNGKEYFDFAGEILPGAALYMNTDSSIPSFQNVPAPEDIRAKLTEKFTLDGIVLNDDDVIAAMDKEFLENETYSSDVVNVSAKNGSFNIKNLLFREQFDKLLSDCEKIIMKTGEKILDGEYYIRPYRFDTQCACTYCPYKSVCNFDSSVNSYRKIQKVTKDTYFDSKE